MSVMEKGLPWCGSSFEKKVGRLVSIFGMKMD